MLFEIDHQQPQSLRIRHAHRLIAEDGHVAHQGLISMQSLTRPHSRIGELHFFLSALFQLDGGDDRVVNVELAADQSA